MLRFDLGRLMPLKSDGHIVGFLAVVTGIALVMGFMFGTAALIRLFWTGKEAIIIGVVSAVSLAGPIVQNTICLIVHGSKKCYVPLSEDEQVAAEKWFKFYRWNMPVFLLVVVAGQSRNDAGQLDAGHVMVGLAAAIVGYLVGILFLRWVTIMKPKDCKNWLGSSF